VQVREGVGVGVGSHSDGDTARDSWYSHWDEYIVLEQEQMHPHRSSATESLQGKV
jgi:hypothetical protein